MCLCSPVSCELSFRTSKGAIGSKEDRARRWLVGKHNLLLGNNNNYIATTTQTNKTTTEPTAKNAPSRLLLVQPSCCMPIMVRSKMGEWRNIKMKDFLHLSVLPTPRCVCHLLQTQKFQEPQVGLYLPLALMRPKDTLSIPHYLACIESK